MAIVTRTLSLEFDDEGLTPEQKAYFEGDELPLDTFTFFTAELQTPLVRINGEDYKTIQQRVLTAATK